jgi:DNA-binding Lrp family transcriptional regulator
MTHDSLDLALIRATQQGLPLVPEPFAAIGASLGIDESEVIARLQAMQRMAPCAGSARCPITTCWVGGPTA